MLNDNPTPTPEHVPGCLCGPNDPIMARRLDVLWQSLDPKWRKFVEACWLQAGTGRDGRILFYEAPAARSGHHHGYIGGLLEHSIEVAETSLFLARMKANREVVRQDLAVAGALVHDVGKVLTYKWTDDGACTRSAMGRQTSHIAVGIALADHAMETGKDDPDSEGMIHDEEYSQIIHILRSHHGLPYAPRTCEALIVHMADLSSAALAVMRDTEIKPNNAVMARWLGVSSLLGRAIRRGRLEMSRIRPQTPGED